jgi:hypothetical protein
MSDEISAEPMACIAELEESSGPAPSLKTAQSFLIALHGYQTAEFTCLPKNSGPSIVMRGTVSELWDRLERLNLAGAGVYFTVSETRGPRCKENVTAMRYLWADIDIKGFYGDAYATDRAAMLGGSLSMDVWNARWRMAYKIAWAAVQAINKEAPASLVTRTGHGWHLYIKTEELTTPEEFSRAERIMKSIAVKHGADAAVTDRARILRLPGSLNTKDDRAEWQLATFNFYPDEKALTLDELATRFGEDRPARALVGGAGPSVLDQMPDHVQQAMAANDGRQVNEDLLAGLHVTTGDDLRRVLAHANPDVDEAYWFRILGAIKATLNGSAESLQIAIEWSSGALIAPKHRDKFTARKFNKTDTQGRSGAEAVNAKWARQSSELRPGDAGMGSLIRTARENGFTGRVEATGEVSPASLLESLTNSLSGPVKSPERRLTVAGAGFGAAAPGALTPAMFPQLFLSAAQMLADPIAINWRVQGLIEDGTTVMIFGPSGAGKSFAVVDLACCISTGRDWHGHVVNQGPVLFLAGEGRGGLPRRLRAWQIASGADLASAKLNISRIAVPFDPAGLILLRQALAEMPEMPVAVFIDTLARHLVGDENSQKDAAQFMNGCDEISHATGAAIVIVHHSGHQAQERARGSSALRAAVDLELAIVPEPGGYQLASTKTKDGAPIPPMAFTLRTVELGTVDSAGRVMTSAVPYFSGTPLPKAPGRPAGRPEVADLVAAHPGLTTDELRPKWRAMGNKSERLSEKLKRALSSGFLRTNEAGKWWSE